MKVRIIDGKFNVIDIYYWQNPKVNMWNWQELIYLTALDYFR